MAQKTVQAFPAIKVAPTLSKGQESSQFRSVQDFLQRFGYLRPAGFRANQLDDSTAAALALYQRRHGLPATGVFDEQTRAQMTVHRCGMPDLDNGIDFVTRCSWPSPQLTFAFEDGTNDIAGAAEFQAVRAAFNT